MSKKKKWKSFILLLWEGIVICIFTIDILCSNIPIHGYTISKGAENRNENGIIKENPISYVCSLHGFF